mmetsp:Transcript_32251/g.86054  ORF Transcript_32251/g.86054 Transcript_32251/m.86054 type:complete len:122 (+) Transcript_32251:272-637(+)
MGGGRARNGSLTTDSRPYHQTPRFPAIPGVSQAIPHFEALFRVITFLRAITLLLAGGGGGAGDEHIPSVGSRRWAEQLGRRELRAWDQLPIVVVFRINTGFRRGLLCHKSRVMGTRIRLDI